MENDKQENEMPIATTWPQAFSNVGVAFAVCACIAAIAYFIWG